MDLPAIEKAMEDMSAIQITDLLVEVSKKEYGGDFVGAMMVALQERKDLDPLYEDERLSEYF